MWICLHCAHENRADQTTCLQCGQRKGVSEGSSVRADATTLLSATNSATHESSESLQTCAKCGARADADAKFCPECRAPLSTSKTMGCPQCGKTVSAAAKFCQYCAADLIGKPTRDSYSPPPATAFPISNYPTRYELPENKEADRYIKIGIGISVFSVFAFLWGNSYVNNIGNAAAAGLASLMGQSNPTFTLATWARGGGLIGIFAGLVLAAVGASDKYR